MKSFVRVCLLCAVGLLFALYHINNMIVDNINNELQYATQNAMFTTQYVPKIMIQDKYLGTHDATLTFSSEEEYFNDFKANFFKQITSDAEYQVICLDSDLSRGLLSVEILGTYKNVLGETKSVHTIKTSIVDVVNLYRKLTPELIRSVNTLYDVGESNLTAEDVVRVGDTDCYVLCVDEENNRAKLITKNLYDVRFHSTSNEYIYYSESDIREWLDNFYYEHLFGNKIVQNTIVKAYYANEWAYFNKGPDYKLVNYEEVDQKVFLLDYFEAKENVLKFDVNELVGGRSVTGFWLNTTIRKGGRSDVAVVRNLEVRTSNGTPFIIYANGMTTRYYYARPVFWVSLDETLYN